LPLRNAYARERRAAALDLLRRARVLEALVQPRRLAVLRAVSAGPRSAPEIAAEIAEPVPVVRLHGMRLADVSLLDVPDSPGARWRLHAVTGGVRMEVVTRPPVHLFALAGGGAGTCRLLMPDVFSRPVSPRELARSLDLSRDAVSRGLASLVAAGAAAHDGAGRVVPSPWLVGWLGELERLADARRAAGLSRHER